MAPAEQRDSFHDHPDHPMPTPISMPEPEPAPAPVLAPAPAPAPRSPLFHLPQISFPRIQIGKKGRIPSLRIEFLRESNQVVSSPAADAAAKTIRISILNHTLKESAETFSVRLSGVQTASLGAISQAAVTIIDND